MAIDITSLFSPFKAFLGGEFHGKLREVMAHSELTKKAVGKALVKLVRYQNAFLEKADEVSLEDLYQQAHLLLNLYEIGIRSRTVGFEPGNDIHEVIRSNLAEVQTLLENANEDETFSELLRKRKTGIADINASLITLQADWCFKDSAYTLPQKPTAPGLV